MKTNLHPISCQSLLVLALCVWAGTLRAQPAQPDSLQIAGFPVAPINHSTVLKMRPLPMVFGVLDLAAEQPISKRGSLMLAAQQTVINGIFLQVIGKVQGVSVAYRYYPLKKQAAPKGFYVGPAISYLRVSNPFFLRLATLFDGSSDLSAWSARAVTGYQHCTRWGLVLDGQVGTGFLYRVRYHRVSSSRQTTIEKRTGAALSIPDFALSVGYRFRSPRSRQ